MLSSPKASRTTPNSVIINALKAVPVMTLEATLVEKFVVILPPFH